MRKPRAPGWKPAGYVLADVEALQALHAGTASEGQQRRALDWIIKDAAETYEQAFRSDADGGERDTSFALGRAFVGQQIVKLVNMPGDVKAKLRKAEND